MDPQAGFASLIMIKEHARQASLTMCFQWRLKRSWSIEKNVPGVGLHAAPIVATLTNYRIVLAKWFMSFSKTE